VVKRRQIERKIAMLEDTVAAEDVAQFHELCEAFAGTSYGTWLGEREQRDHSEPVPTHA